MFHNLSVPCRAFVLQLEVLGWNLSFGTEAWLDFGDIAGAASMAREAMEIAEKIGSATSINTALCALCRVRVSEGNLAAALPLAEEWAGSDTCSKFQLPWAKSTLALVLCTRGERDEARRLAHEALAYAETAGFASGRLWCELALARIDASDASPDAHEQAVGWLTRAEQTLQETGCFARLPDLLELRAELSRQRGDAAGCEAALREALSVYQERGAVPNAERIARELAS